MHLCLKLLCAKAFCAQCLFCARDFSLTVRAFWRAKQLRWVDASFEEMRKVDQCSDEMKTVEKNLLRWHVRRNGMRWEELRWGEKRWEEVRRSQMRWDEMKCGVWSARVKKVFTWRCIAPGSRAGHVLGQQQRNRFAQSTHARAWQLPPRLVRALLESNSMF